MYRSALVSLEFLTQDAEPSGTTLVDARNGFNELRRLEMLWTVRHRWPAGARFTFNLYLEVEEDRGCMGEDEGGGTQRALGALEFLTQEAEPSGTTLVDARNGFSKLRRLAML